MQRQFQEDRKDKLNKTHHDIVMHTSHRPISDEHMAHVRDINELLLNLDVATRGKAALQFVDQIFAALGVDPAAAAKELARESRTLQGAPGRSRQLESAPSLAATAAELSATSGKLKEALAALERTPPAPEATTQLAAALAASEAAQQQRYRREAHDDSFDHGRWAQSTLSALKQVMLRGPLDHGREHVLRAGPDQGRRARHVRARYVQRVTPWGGSRSTRRGALRQDALPATLAGQRGELHKKYESRELLAPDDFVEVTREQMLAWADMARAEGAVLSPFELAWPTSSARSRARRRNKDGRRRASVVHMA